MQFTKLQRVKLLPSDLMLFLLHPWCKLPACRNHILLSDLEYFLDTKSAKECFDILDLDRDNKISLQVVRGLGHPCCLHEER